MLFNWNQTDWNGRIIKKKKKIETVFFSYFLKIIKIIDNYLCFFLLSKKKKK